MEKKFKGGYKQYLKATPGQIVNYLKDEARLVSPKTLGDFEAITVFDMRGEVCFFIHLDSRIVGFACFKPEGVSDRRLTKIYVTPNARRHGCASFVIRGLKISSANVAVKYVEILGLLRRIGLQYKARQSYPNQVAELVRPNNEKSNVQHQLPAAQLG